MHRGVSAPGSFVCCRSGRSSGGVRRVWVTDDAVDGPGEARRPLHGPGGEASWKWSPGAHRPDGQWRHQSQRICGHRVRPRPGLSERHRTTAWASGHRRWSLGLRRQWRSTSRGRTVVSPTQDWGNLRHSIQSHGGVWPNRMVKMKNKWKPA